MKFWRRWKWRAPAGVYRVTFLRPATPVTDRPLVMGQQSDDALSGQLNVRESFEIRLTAPDGRTKVTHVHGTISYTLSVPAEHRACWDRA